MMLLYCKYTRPSTARLYRPRLHTASDFLGFTARGRSSDYCVAAESLFALLSFGKFNSAAFDDFFAKLLIDGIIARRRCIVHEEWPPKRVVNYFAAKNIG